MRLVLSLVGQTFYQTKRRVKVSIDQFCTGSKIFAPIKVCCIHHGNYAVVRGSDILDG